MTSLFLPDAGSPVLQLDADMRADLAQSLARLGERAGRVLPGDVDMASACDHIRARRVEPGLFAAYYDLVHALQAEDWGRCARLWCDIADRAGHDVRLECRAYDPALMGEDALRFQRLFAMGWQEPVMFARPDAGGWARFQADVVDGLALLQGVSPEWRREIESLITHVYAALPPEGDGRRFAGASSFMVWGAVFLNVRRNDNRLRVLAGLAHEATHQMLFGLSRHQPLTENPPGLRYASPLRRDPRPMDGVYHATYVSGRLGHLYRLLSRAEGLSDVERADLHTRIDRQRRRFADGYAVVRAEGRLSSLGRELIEAAADAVAGLAVA